MKTKQDVFTEAKKKLDLLYKNYYDGCITKTELDNRTICVIGLLLNYKGE